MENYTLKHCQGVFRLNVLRCRILRFYYKVKGKQQVGTNCYNFSLGSANQN